MKIVHTTIRYPPAIGGVESYVADLCAGLRDHGHQVQVYTSDLAQHLRPVPLPPQVPRVERGGVAVRRLHAVALPGIAGYPLLPALLRRLATVQADVIHGHCFNYCSADFAALMGHLRGIPFVLTPHFTPAYTPKWRMYQRTLGRLTMRADVTAVVSPFEQQTIEGLGFRVRCFAPLPPAVDVAAYQGPRDAAFLARYGINPQDHQTVLFVGRVCREKGVDLLIRAAQTVVRRAPETRFLLVGPDWGDRPAFETQVVEAGLAGKVIFTGDLPRCDVLAAYRSADLLGFPSRYEAFGIVLIEAMAAGLPVVATRTAAIPYVVEHGHTGLLSAPEDTDALAAGLLQLLRDPALRATMGATAARHAATQYSRAAQVQQAEAIYRSVM
ncbi:MAG: glycosyltransferase family 4 protein [Chloroflexota bacterium]|nr:glycosyltransferase family 4 protein [Chloroflexota bacterium]